jgi:hypothetical protein
MELLNRIKQPFSTLSFEEKEHKYFVEEEPIKISVSGLISQYYEKFNAHEVSAKVSQRTGVPQTMILQDWLDINKESIERGHRVHSFGELYQFDRSLKPSCPQEEAIVKFWQEVPEHIIPVAAELRMYHFKELYAGTADIILFDTKTQTYIIADYKTNKDLYKNFKGKTMTGVFSHLLDCPLNHYVIQLSYYQILLEQVGVQVGRRVIIWLGLDGNYTLIDTEDVRNLLK